MTTRRITFSINRPDQGAFWCFHAAFWWFPTSNS